MRFIAPLAAALLLLAPAVPAQDLTTDSDAVAQAPSLLTYSGLLTDADGAPLPDGTHTLTFRAYASEAAGDAVWTETHDATVAAGQFWVVLGARTPLADGAEWYTVSVDGAPESEAVHLGGGASSAGLAPGNTLDQSYENGSFVNIDQGRPIVLRGAPGAFYTGLQIQNITAVFSNDELVRFRLRSINGGASWEYRVYGAQSTGPTAPPPGSFAISNASNAGAIDPFVIRPSATQGLLSLLGSTARFGGPSNLASVDVYTTPNPLNPDGGFVGLSIRNDNNTGSESTWYTEDGVIHTRIEADGGGEGGFFTVANGSGGAAFQVNGSNSGGSRTTLGVGTDRSIFDDTETGDDSVVLPNNSVSSAETSEEAGVANQASGTLVTLTPGYDVLISRSITPPTSGYVIAIASVDVQFSHTSGGGTSAAEFAVTDDCDASPTVGSASDFDISIPTNVASGFFNFPISPSGLFPVSAGATTICLVGSELSGDATSIDHQLALVFVPTAYGSTVSSLADGAPSVTDGDGPTGRAMTTADIAAERAASARANEARLAAELDALRARLDAIEAEREADRDGDGIQNAQRRR